MSRLAAARQAYRTVRKRAKRIASHGSLAWLRARNRLWRGSVLGSADVICSLTSHGRRIDTVAFTIESIAFGKTRPRRLILWLDDEQAYQNRPNSLRRLERRGLEVRMTLNLGPHTKYYPSLPLALAEATPLVTADDDILYPRRWLQRLCRANARYPGLVNCYWASVIQVSAGTIEPYTSWPRAKDTRASLRNFATGVSGVIYPPRMVQELHDRGLAFRNSCPRADDIWLHWVALRAGVEVRQLAGRARHFPLVPGTQGVALVAENVAGGGNDKWIRKLYSSDDVNRLERAAAPAGQR